MSFRDLPRLPAVACGDAGAARTLDALVDGDLSPSAGDADGLCSPTSYVRSRVSSLDWYKTGCSSGSALSFCSEICEFHAVLGRKDSFSSLSSGGNLVVSRSRTSSPAVSPTGSLRLPSLSLERTPSRKRSLANLAGEDEEAAWASLRSPRRRLAPCRTLTPAAAAAVAAAAASSPDAAAVATPFAEQQ